MLISFSLRKSMEVSFPGSSDQFKLKPGVLLSRTPIFSLNLYFNSWDDYARGFIRLKYITIIDGQLSATNFDLIWSWKIYPSEICKFSLTKNFLNALKFPDSQFFPDEDYAEKNATHFT